VTQSRKPTEAELAILRVLWARGPSTVRDVAAAMGRQDAYTTVLKLMQIMAAKGLVARDDAERAHVYHATYTEEQTQRHLVRDLVDRAFGGSASALVMQALASSPTSDEEMRAIRRVLDRARRDARRAPAVKAEQTEKKR
jgi:predicted transcriptional regulator